MNVLITGASRGIGLEMVKYCMEQNWRVFACCRHPQQADALLSAAKLANGRVSVHVADMNELATIQALAYELRNEAIDIIINNAGIYGSDKNSFGSVDVQSWLETFQVNSIAPQKVHINNGCEAATSTGSSRRGSQSRPKRPQSEGTLHHSYGYLHEVRYLDDPGANEIMCKFHPSLL